MDDKALSRLLMDRALGALPPDTEALVSAYLEHDSAAAARARQFETAALAARRALQQPTASLPPFPAGRMLAVAAATRRLRVIRTVASLAAVLVIGIGVGFSVAQRGDTVRARAPVPLPVREGSIRSAARGTFWSTEHMYENAHVARSVDSARWIWDSAVSQPRPGAKS